MNTTNTSLYYVYDPMCSWCYGFNPVWQRLIKQLPSSIEVIYVLGGLAPDSDKLMPKAMQQTIAKTWQKVTKVTGVEFNADFWQKTQPRRSTYPACRAALVARKLAGTIAERQLTTAIQTAYYQKAQNPSDTQTLVQCARQIGLNSAQFTQLLRSNEIQQDLQRELALVNKLRCNSFPSLFLSHNNKNHSIAIDYQNELTILSKIKRCLQQ